MIEDYLAMINLRLDNVKLLDQSSHFPIAILEPAEKELLLGDAYIKGKPEGYPSDKGEKLGLMIKKELRSSKNPAEASYQNMRLRTGISTLHIKDKKSRKNLEAITLIYMGESNEMKLGDNIGKAHLGNVATLILFLENGVVSASYLFPLFVAVNSWYPEEKEGYGGFPYPNNPVEISNIMEKAFEGLPISDDSLIKSFKDTKSFRAMPNLVMLCVNIYRQCEKS